MVGLAAAWGFHEGGPGCCWFGPRYGEMDSERELEGSGWFSRDPLEVRSLFGGQWKTADFRAGDVLCFTMKTLHMYVRRTARTRPPCDTASSPASQSGAQSAKESTGKPIVLRHRIAGMMV